MATRTLTDRPPFAWIVTRRIGLIVAYLVVPASLIMGPTVESPLSMLAGIYFIAAIGIVAVARGSALSLVEMKVGYVLLGLYCLLLAVELINADLMRWPRPLVSNFFTVYFALLALPFLAIGLREVGLNLDVLEKAIMATIAFAVAWSLYRFLVLGESRPGGLHNLNPIVFGTVVAVWGTFLLARALRSERVDVVAAAFGIAALVPVLLSGSRTVWASAAVGYAVPFLWWAWSHRRWIALVAIPLGTIAAALVAYQVPSVRVRIDHLDAEVTAFVTAGETLGSTGLRLATTISGFLAFLERPLTGYGLADAQVAALIHRPADVVDFTGLWHLHNEYITHAVAFGIAGPVFLAVLIGLFIWVSWRCADTALSRAGVATTLMVAVYMATGSYFSRTPLLAASFYMFALVLAFGAVASRSERGAPRHRTASVALAVAAALGLAGAIWSQREIVLAPEAGALLELSLAPETARTPTLLYGQVHWSFVDAGPFGPEVIADIGIPERRQTIRFAIRRNTDDQLPASHVIEIEILSSPVPGRRIADAFGVYAKPSREDLGKPLIGALIKVAEDKFWMVLSDTSFDERSNLVLLREGNAFEITFAYDDGRRAGLVFEKGRRGESAFAEAMTAWSQ